MKPISNHVYAFLTKRAYVNFYVVANDDGLTVIDIALSAADVDTLKTGLRTRGWKLSDVKRILITHAHTDHVGGLAELQYRCPEARTYAHQRTAPVLRGEETIAFADPATLRGFSRLMHRFIRGVAQPARVDRELQDGDSLDEVLPGLQAVHLPGHSYGHTGFWWPEGRLLIGGDVMMHYPWGLRMPLRAPSPDWEEAKQSIHKVAEMDVDVLCLGHGQPILDEAHVQIKQLSARIKAQ
jgi:glyoxylase-like metal-dependent hydrolase (beta-lactamase superfamily II)